MVYVDPVIPHRRTKELLNLIPWLHGSHTQSITNVNGDPIPIDVVITSQRNYREGGAPPPLKRHKKLLSVAGATSSRRSRKMSAWVAKQTEKNASQIEKHPIDIIRENNEKQKKDLEIIYLENIERILDEVLLPQYGTYHRHKQVMKGNPVMMLADVDGRYFPTFKVLKPEKYHFSEKYPDEYTGSRFIDPKTVKRGLRAPRKDPYCEACKTRFKGSWEDHRKSARHLEVRDNFDFTEINKWKNLINNRTHIPSKSEHSSDDSSDSDSESEQMDIDMESHSTHTQTMEDVPMNHTTTRTVKEEKEEKDEKEPDESPIIPMDIIRESPKRTRPNTEQNITKKKILNLNSSQAKKLCGKFNLPQDGKSPVLRKRLLKSFDYKLSDSPQVECSEEEELEECEEESSFPSSLVEKTKELDVMDVSQESESKMESVTASNSTVSALHIEEDFGVEGIDWRYGCCDGSTPGDSVGCSMETCRPVAYYHEKCLKEKFGCSDEEYARISGSLEAPFECPSCRELNTKKFKSQPAKRGQAKKKGKKKKQKKGKRNGKKKGAKRKKKRA